MESVAITRQAFRLSTEYFNRFTVAGQRQIPTGFPCSMQKVLISEHTPSLRELDTRAPARSSACKDLVTVAAFLEHYSVSGLVLGGQRLSMTQE